ASDSHPAVRQKAMEVLGKVKPFTDEAKEALLRGLSDRSEGVRIAAINSAAERQVKEALSLILSMLEGDSSKVVRRHAAEALFNFGEKAEVVGGLKKGLKDSAQAVRVGSALSLAKLGSSAGLNAAIEGVNSSEARIRQVSCMVFANAGNEKSLIFLERALEDSDSRVRRAAKDAVFRIKERLDEK
ncbi:MAG: HEAT repeat domain-containing protein, partial [Elusimicrobiota bacterium]